ncbi:hypothetical protein [Roseinatronobacter sp. NSM]|uniref:hypothetical protein n=1 Tax=Roseinatronobacter sp. NSM TaxID=3457785 RepID=UPI0040360FF7
MGDLREAQWVDFLPVDGEARSFAVGDHVRATNDPNEAPERYIKVTRITVQCDLPGLHCDMWRVCVWSGDAMIVEVPLHNTAGVGYAMKGQADEV